jgi:hypothetical protein
MLFDVLQNFAFSLWDVSRDSGIPVFLPVLGFSRCTAPEYRIEAHKIKRGNLPFERHVTKRVATSPITVHRGARFFDADFYRWVNFAITGRSERGVRSGAAVQGRSPRKELLLIQFFRGIPFVSGGAGALSQIGGYAAAAASLATVTAKAGIDGAVAMAPTLAAAAAFVAMGNGAFAIRVPARAWLLHDCGVSRFKAASDFDANSADVSQMELEFQATSFEEFSLSAN